MGEKDYLGAASRKMFSNGCTNTGCATLHIISYTQLAGSISITVIMITLECIKRSDVLLAPPKYIFRSHTKNSTGKIFRRGTTNGNKDAPSNTALASI